ncbi:mate-domain-containing protein [Syncephalis pseudoplumigaleata]|uniref:Mate-domain-containing protein n=1 Tax=Syncephalis pseudoplumigaleata TaxID=1712513 RepID=A0A4V1J1V4_9FUNG|nr:mate-domain-containing protein [Syncephalis pseudoplumigaleata]|eukprot:RKP26369.1 mate-domain-containing protein [Syncephalis pseudoplumigaleata]
MRDIRRESCWLLRNSSPISFTLVLRISTSIIASICLGHLVHLAAGSLGDAFVMLVCTSWLVGMASALDTLCSQTFTAGSQNSKLLSLHVQRSLVILAVCFLPMVAVCWKAESFFLLMGRDTEVARLAGKYACWKLLHIPGFMVADVFLRFLQSQGDMQTGARVLCLTSPIGAVLSYILIIVFRDSVGFIGAAIAIALAHTLGAVFIVRKAVSLPTWHPWTSAALSGWTPFLKLGRCPHRPERSIPGIFMSCNEIWVIELLTIVVSSFGPVAVAAQTITLHDLPGSVTAGIAVATSNRVGNYLGAGRAMLARVSSWTALAITVSLACFYAVCIVLFRNRIGAIYSNDQKVVDLAGELLPIGALFHIFVAVALICDGILRGQGRQSYGAGIRVVTFYVIGIPLAALLTLYGKLQLAGLWLAFLGAMLLTAILEITLIAKTDWPQLSIASQRRVRRDEAKLDQGILAQSNASSASTLAADLDANLLGAATISEP